MSESWPPADSSGPGQPSDPRWQPQSGYPGPGQYPVRPSWPGQLGQPPYPAPIPDNRSNWPSIIGPILVILSGLWAFNNLFEVSMAADVGYKVGYRLPALLLACLAVGLCILGIRRSHSTGRGEVPAIVGVTFGSLVIVFALLEIGLVIA